MSSSPLTPEQAEQAERIFQSLRQAVESDLRSQGLRTRFLGDLGQYTQ